jgi:hypothetical protein
MQATSVEARACIAALVAEYVHAARAPDRVYRRALSLFTDATTGELPILDEVARTVIVLATRNPDAKILMLEATFDRPPKVRIWCPAAGDPRARAQVLLDNQPGTMSVVQLLIRHGFARDTPPPGGAHDATGIGHAMFDRGEPLEGLEILVSCLAVLPEPEST